MGAKSNEPPSAGTAGQQLGNRTRNRFPEGDSRDLDAASTVYPNWDGHAMTGVWAEISRRIEWEGHFRNCTSVSVH